MVKLLAQALGDQVRLKYLPEMEQEYAFWMRGASQLPSVSSVPQAAEHVVRLTDGALLNRYFDRSTLPREEMLADDVALHPEHVDSSAMYREVRAACESGWDFSTRWLTDVHDKTSMCVTSLVPVDLSCLMVLYEEELARAHELSGNTSQSSRFRKVAQARRHAVRSYCWSMEHAWYVDYNFRSSTRSPHVTLAGAYPLWAGIAQPEEAQKMAKP